MKNNKSKNPFSQLYDTIHKSGQTIFNYVDSSLNKTFGEKYNLFYFLGTIPIFLLFFLLLTGLYMFIFYGLAIDNTYSSVKYITEEAPLGWIIRGIHRYAADFMVFFIILHMIRTFVEGKYQTHRKLAWITGVILFFFTLTEGITGYMMSLNSVAHFVLTKTSELFASTGILGESLPRTFAMSSLMGKWIMWIILIIHFAIPLIFAFLIYIHIMRVSRAKIFLSRSVMIAGSIFLITIAIIFPIEMKSAVDYNKIPYLEQIDWFYLFLSPFMKEGNYLYVILGIVSVFLILIGVPWYKKKMDVNHSVLDLEKCTGCSFCALDCPYEALQMQVRTDDNLKYKQEVKIDAKLCAGCGICVGACDFSAMSLKHPDLPAIKENIQKVIMESHSDNKWVGIFCNCLFEPINKDSLKKELPNMYSISLPCSAMLGQNLIEEIKQFGVKGIIIGSCPEGNCEYREGNIWLKQRILGERSPRFHRLDNGFPVAQIRFNKVQLKDFIDLAKDFIQNNSSIKEKAQRYISSVKQGKALYHYSVVTIVLSLLVWGVYFGSIRNYILPSDESKKSLLKVNFFYKSSQKRNVESKKLHSKEYQLAVNKEYKRLSKSFHLNKVSEETKKSIRKIAERKIREKLTGRERLPLLIEIYIDNYNSKPIIKTTYHPSGFRKDSLIYVHKDFYINPGMHKILIKAYEVNGTNKVHALKPFEMNRIFNVGKSYFVDFSSSDSKFYLRTR